MTLFKSFLLKLLVTSSLFSQLTHAGAFSEGFENVNQLPSTGWIFDNQSDFVGDLFWSQGLTGVFPAQAGPDNSYLLGGVGQTGGDILCDWLVLPDIGFVDQFNFYTRTETNSSAPDRLLVVYSASGGTNTGPCVINDAARNSQGNNEFGDFVPILSINPNLDSGVYPNQWTQFSVPVNGDGRLALVYFVDNVGVNGNLIAIDSINIGPGVPPVNSDEIAPVPSLSLAGIFMLLLLVIVAVKKNMVFKQN